MFWAIQYPDGYITPSFCKYTRKESMDAFVLFMNEPWKRKYKQGFRAIRVNIIPTKELP